MSKKEQKRKPDTKQKAKKLKLKKQTVKDLEPEESSRVKAGMPPITHSCLRYCVPWP